MSEEKDAVVRDADTYAVGIDLGTTYSCIAVWRDGKVTYIPNASKQLTTPSVIGFTSSDCLIGHEAREQSSLNPLNTIFENKRIIGRKFHENTVQNDIERYPFTVKQLQSNDDTTEKDKPSFEVSYKSERVIFEPEQIAALMLSSLKHDAERYLNGAVHNAVITVPAYFNDSQRQATKDAGVIAGLNVLRVINEPTAAAIAYGLDKCIATDEYRVLIFDLGGGTFDVSLLSITDGFFEVKATAGNTHLGGEDFDNRITDYIKTQLIQAFIDKHPNIVHDIHANASLLRELRTRCERLKCELASAESAQIEIEYGDGDVFEYTLTRDKLNGLCDDLFVLCLETMEKVFRDSEMSRDEIDDVVLVGGSTRIVKIRQMIGQFFDGTSACICTDIDAAVQSAILSVNDANSNAKCSADNGCMTVLIPRNVNTALYDEQEVVQIEVYEGERTRTRDNNLLGRFEVAAIKKETRGIPQIEVVFVVNENGILSVTATDQNNPQNKGNLVITNDKGRLTKHQIENMILSAHQHQQKDALLKGKLTALAAAEHYLYALNKVVEAKQMQLEQSSKTTQKQSKIKSGFKWVQNENKVKKNCSCTTSEEEEEEEEEIKEEIDDELLLNATRLDVITKDDLCNMQQLYETYSAWFRENATNCLDSAQIDDKQNELELKLGKNITNCIRDSYRISRGF
eukprot:615916_1